MKQNRPRRVRISLARPSDRPSIYAMRHEVYAEELGQHASNSQAALSDPLDEFNIYLVAHLDGHLAGFISITPPGHGRYSIDKYVHRDDLGITFDDGLYELRLLTIAKEHRHSRLAAMLMYAAFRWVEDRGGRHVIAMGRTEIVSIYLKHGLRPLGRQVRCGAVTFELLETEIEQLRSFAECHHTYYTRLRRDVFWDVDFEYFKPERCYHGGAFFEAIGAGFDDLDRSKTVVNADVLDAWFPPSPKVIEALTDNLPWLLKTSPPIHGEGLRAAISHSRGIAMENVLPGAGSSALIYLAFREWLNESSRVLILDPMYGEYAHVLDKVIRCKTDRLRLSRRNGYGVDLTELAERMTNGYDLIVLVNPNNPTGCHVPRREFETLLETVSTRTRVWIDEAYVDYVGPDESLEPFAADSHNVVVCKTMSKVYALSGTRVGYLCGPAQQISQLAPLTPPWAIGLPAQVAAVRALEDAPYYAARYRETRQLRKELESGLRELGIEEIVPGQANFLMFHLKPEHPTAAEIVNEAKKSMVFVRDASQMGRDLGLRSLRIGVKSREMNTRILEAVSSALRQSTSIGHIACEPQPSFYQRLSSAAGGDS